MTQKESITSNTSIHNPEVAGLGVSQLLFQRTFRVGHHFQ